MALSLATILTNALSGISGFNTPSSFVGSANPTAKTLVAVANEAGCDLERLDRWQELIDEHTFATANGTATYDLPEDFRAFANCSQWDRTNIWRFLGPIPSMVWQWLQSGLTVASTSRSWFMVRQNKFAIYPTPTDIRTVAFDYYNKYWVLKASDQTTTYYWTNDNDTPLLDDALLTADVKWRFLQAKGMPFETEYKRWESIKEALQSDNGGRTVIDMNGSAPSGGIGEPNIPDTGYGS